MISGQSFVKVLCALTFLGLNASARGINNVKANITAFQGPSQFWRGGEEDWWCDDVDDFFKYPHPYSCELTLRCFGGILYEEFCEDDSMIFDDLTWTCMDANEAVCDRDIVDPDHDDRCPPPGSNDVVFIESKYCEQFYICMNGNPIQLNCRPGQHWNVDGEFCDDPEKAGCEVSNFQYF